MTLTLILVAVAIFLGPVLGHESRPDFVERPDNDTFPRPLG
jgi:hypothetical protein